MKDLYETTDEFNIQDVFDLLIEKGTYDEHDSEQYASSSYMCSAVSKAKKAGLISEDYAYKTFEAIEEYLGVYVTLEDLLEDNNLPRDFNSRKNLYLDWVNRPKFV